MENSIGIFNIYYEKGPIWKEESYKDGELDGVTRAIKEDGSLAVEMVFKDERL